MKFGMLTDHFQGAGAKRLTQVEVNKLRSNQHEFQGVSAFRSFLGEPAEKTTFPATFYWLDDDEDNEPLVLTSFSTWSDVRRTNPNRSAEYHLYYSADSEPVVHKASAGDLLIVAKTKQDTLHLILCPSDTTIAQQLLWLFGIDLIGTRTAARMLSTSESIPLSFAARSILDSLGIEIEEPEPDAFGKLIDRYGWKFPGTAEFSAFARETFGEADPLGAPDESLLAWMDHEEALFRHLERHEVSARLEQGFMAEGNADVEGFLSFSLRVQNRRKSRAGWALGHHVEAILSAHNLHYTREAKTEKRNGPDFLFPGESEYHDPDFDPALLTMLGAKTSCKDRWRQVLAEAHKIKTKHLLTLQPGISKTQTNEMQAENLQLVIPEPIFTSYTPEQRAWLMDIRGFVELVKARQT
ncbi:MAG: type II restriction endonuclease [Woeseia sp.]